MLTLHLGAMDAICCLPCYNAKHQKGIGVQYSEQNKHKYLQASVLQKIQAWWNLEGCQASTLAWAAFVCFVDGVGKIEILEQACGINKGRCIRKLFTITKYNYFNCAFQNSQEGVRGKGRG